MNGSYRRSVRALRTGDMARGAGVAAHAVAAVLRVGEERVMQRACGVAGSGIGGCVAKHARLSEI